MNKIKELEDAKKQAYKDRDFEKAKEIQQQLDYYYYGRR